MQRYINSLEAAIPKNNDKYDDIFYMVIFAINKYLLLSLYV
ncbi:hypothetical protein HMPREF1860_00065 [Prevotella amnii]|uniref:Uncharacterized protein n=1 Tax=Prevotella amnii TaxID=419005 RepID=A0A134BPU5_9BACT|nr:hypothetical protein HMPREF1860_00065 [Prevotella amnii]